MDPELLAYISIGLLRWGEAIARAQAGEAITAADLELESFDATLARLRGAAGAPAPDGKGSK